MTHPLQGRSLATLGTLCFIVITTVAPDPGMADVQVALVARQSELGRLGPDQPSSSVAVSVDSASVIIMIQILAPTDALITSITGPNGEFVNPGNVNQFGGQFTFSADTGGTGGFIITPLDHVGDRYEYELPSLGAGLYEVNFALAAPPLEDIPIIVEVMLDSSLISVLFVTEWILPLGETAVACLALFDGSTPVAAAEALLTITAPNADTLEGVPLCDDGGDADGMAGDGLYSAAFLVDQVGEYLLESRAMTGGQVRTSAASIVVVEPGATLRNAPITSQLVDENGNGLAENLGLDVPVDVDMTASYVVIVSLLTPSGTPLSAYGSAELGSGAGTIAAALDAATVRGTGEDGPYQITTVYLRRISDDGILPSDRIEGFDMPTIPFLLDQFERPPVLLTGDNADVAIDGDGDGDFDSLSIGIGIDVLVPGTYEFSARLVDPCGGEIEFFAGEQELLGGSGEMLETEITGSLIGANGIDGPYAIQDLLVFGPGGSLVATSAAQTQMYEAVEFEAFVAPPDCNSNGVADQCDLFFGDSLDENGNGLPDECEGGGDDDDDDDDSSSDSSSDDSASSDSGSGAAA